MILKKIILKYLENFKPGVKINISNVFTAVVLTTPTVHGKLWMIKIIFNNESYSSYFPITTDDGFPRKDIKLIYE